MCTKCNKTPCCCKKTISVRGKRGPQGSPGPQGLIGPQGPKGDPGSPAVVGDGFATPLDLTIGPAIPTIVVTAPAIPENGDHLVWSEATYVPEATAIGTYRIFKDAEAAGVVRNLGASAAAAIEMHLNLGTIDRINGLLAGEILSMKVTMSIANITLSNGSIAYLKIN